MRIARCVVETAQFFPGQVYAFEDEPEGQLEPLLARGKFELVNPARLKRDQTVHFAKAMGYPARAPELS